MKYQVLIACLLLFQFFSFGQKYDLTNTFNIEDGLPSNQIYDICEDKEGYLWICTDNGVSRFDGRRFVNYSTRDGLPSSETIDINITVNGTIWVNCFKQSPSFFDKKKNQFICLDSYEEVRKISSALLHPKTTNNESIIYGSNLGYIELDKDKLIRFGKMDDMLVTLTKDRITSLTIDYGKSRLGNVFTLKSENEYKTIGTNLCKSGSFTWESPQSDYIHIVKKNKLICISEIRYDPMSFQQNERVFPDPIHDCKIRGESIFVIDRGNTLSICDKYSLKVRLRLPLITEANSAFQDSKGQIWIATIEEGLMLYSKSSIQKVEIENQNVLRVTKTKNKGLLFGGNQNQLIQLNNKEVNTFNLTHNSVQRIEQILAVRNDIYIFTSSSWYKNLKEESFDKKDHQQLFLKSAELLNDETIIFGSQGGICSLNTINDKIIELPSELERVTEIAKIDDKHFYFLGNRGVSVYSLLDSTFRPVLLNSTFSKNKPTLLCVDESKHLWVATAKGDIYLFNKNATIKQPIQKLFVNDNITDIFARKNRLWITTKTGLFVLDYPSNSNRVVHKLTECDGLSSNHINSLSCYNDTIYLATSKGISTLPTNISFNKSEVKPSIISILINGKNIGNRLKYQLTKNQRNATVHLAGIDLTGHFDKFTFAINNKNNWSYLEGNYLNIALNHGETKVYIQAVDINGNISSKRLVLVFNVPFPFYYRIWFIVIVCIIIILIVISFAAQQRSKKQRLQFEKELALKSQRNKITADLHDDIGATLSSLQINSAVANHLIDHKPFEAKNILVNIENQSHDLGDRIGDIVWSMKPEKDEFISFSARVKNFANDILGATEVDYKISIDDTVDRKLVDITERKNLILMTKEAINNAAKHSKADKLHVEIRLINQQITLKIEDNGVGFSKEEKLGNGLFNMEKRVNELGGKLRIDSTPNGGTRIFATIPCPSIKG